ncbi:MAG: NAD(P)-dependent oxidoreductase [SAR202 cluster bacterium]|nr:NAD(P)-dependent oxidoreductase [SAR202 cluster bacterium]|tara:strand:- start:1280 stop:2212 length:933 start_codon:yes stop_codon:yes gene_type:complete
MGKGSDTVVGFIGLGNMGSGMSMNIAKSGYKMIVHDLDRNAAIPILEFGAEWADSPREVAEKCDVIFTSLPGPLEVEAVATGENGLLEGVSGSSVWLDLSTSSPTLIRRLADTFGNKGATVMDAPISGGVRGAQKGLLAVMVGGDRDTFDQLLPLLESFGDKVTYTGDIGAGSICKLMHNSIGYGMQMILSECLTLGVKAGVEAEALVECIRNGSVGRGNLLNVTLPETYFKGKFDPPNFALKLARKDVALALELGREYDVPMEAASHAYNELTAALNRGWAEQDSRIALLLQEERAGNIEVRLAGNDDE